MISVCDERRHQREVARLRAQQQRDAAALRPVEALYFGPAWECDLCLTAWPVR